MSQPDDVILRTAHSEQRILVTFDVHSMPVVIRHFAESGVDHSGVVLISTKTLGQDDAPHLAAALERFANLYGDQSLNNQVLFLSDTN